MLGDRAAEMVPSSSMFARTVTLSDIAVERTRANALASTRAAELSGIVPLGTVSSSQELSESGIRLVAAQERNAEWPWVKIRALEVENIT